MWGEGLHHKLLPAGALLLLVGCVPLYFVARDAPSPFGRSGTLQSAHSDSLPPVPSPVSCIANRADSSLHGEDCTCSRARTIGTHS